MLPATRTTMARFVLASLAFLALALVAAPALAREKRGTIAGWWSRSTAWTCSRVSLARQPSSLCAVHHLPCSCNQPADVPCTLQPPPFPTPLPAEEIPAVCQETGLNLQTACSSDIQRASKYFGVSADAAGARAAAARTSPAQVEAYLRANPVSSR